MTGEMKAYALHALFLLVFLTSFVSSNIPPDFSLVSHLPASWSNMCKVSTNSSDDVNATISCHVTPDDAVQWRLADLRTALEPSVSARHFEVSVRIVCETGGNISLPWPMRSPGLVRLTVYNCRLLDKFGDFGTSALQLGDSLREVDMRNCTWVNEPGSLDIMLDNIQNISSHYECGQDSTLQVYIYRNISDELEFQNILNSGGGGFDTSGLGNLLGGLPNGTGGLGGQGGLLNGTGDLASILNGSAGLGDLGMLPTGSTSGATGAKEGSSGLATSSPKGVSSVDPKADVLDTIMDLDSLQSSCNFERLEFMDESFNPLTSKNHFEFMVKSSKFPRLRVMNYTYIGLTDIPRELREWRRFFPQLRTLDLSHNYVQEVDTIVPYKNDVPLTLVLQHNNITRITMDMFKEWARVPAFHVDIRNNPLACGCDLGHFLEVYQDESQWAGEVLGRYRSDVSELRCATPAELSGRTLKSLQRSDLPCPVAVADLRAAMSVLAVVVVLLLVLLLLAVRYRREVRILVFTRVHVLLPCGLPHALGVEAPDKQYDAFVAYAHQDSEWVLGQLMPQLETPSRRACGPCKLCIHQRDFIVGKPIIDNIIDCIAASRHTIVILSKSFARSAWAMEELQQAYRQSLEERRRHLVLVVLEDVPQKDMAPLLRRCCKTFTYLHASDTLFWDRLMYSIHVSGENMTRKKENKEEKSDDEYDNIACDKSTDVDVEKGLEPSSPSPELKEMFQRALFLETVRTLSVESGTSTGTFSDDRNLVVSTP